MIRGSCPHPHPHLHLQLTRQITTPHRAQLEDGSFLMHPAHFDKLRAEGMSAEELAARRLKHAPRTRTRTHTRPCRLRAIRLHDSILELRRPHAPGRGPLHP